MGGWWGVGGGGVSLGRGLVGALWGVCVGGDFSQLGIPPRR